MVSGPTPGTILSVEFPVNICYTHPACPHCDSYTLRLALWPCSLFALVLIGSRIKRCQGFFFYFYILVQHFLILTVQFFPSCVPQYKIQTFCQMTLKYLSWVALMDKVSTSVFMELILVCHKTETCWDKRVLGSNGFTWFLMSFNGIQERLWWSVS